MLKYQKILNFLGNKLTKTFKSNPDLGSEVFLALIFLVFP